MSYKMSSRLYVDLERVIEIRIRDLRERKGIKQKSFSIEVDEITKDNQYPAVESLISEFKKAIKKLSK